MPSMGPNLSHPCQKTANIFLGAPSELHLQLLLISIQTVERDVSKRNEHDFPGSAGFYGATTKVVENLNNKQLSRVSS